MSLPVHLTCPLGHKCETAVDGEIRRCAWFTKLQGQHPQTGEILDEYGCAMSWLPILLIESSRAATGTSAAVESFRNEMAAGNQQLAAVLTKSQPLLLNGDR